jgi:alpha/beta superfamily hydrolase
MLGCSRLHKAPNLILLSWLDTGAHFGSVFRARIHPYSLTLTKDAGYAAFGELWARDAGFASLILDYRGFGASGGKIRNIVSPTMQTEDYKAVIGWARERPELFRLEKLVVMGGAGSGLCVAQLVVEDRELAGGMAHCPVLDGRVCVQLHYIQVLTRLLRPSNSHVDDTESPSHLLGRH